MKQSLTLREDMTTDDVAHLHRQFCDMKGFVTQNRNVPFLLNTVQICSMFCSNLKSLAKFGNSETQNIHVYS